MFRADYWQTGEEKNISNEFTFMVGGDMMFDRFIDHNFPGDKLKDSVKNLGNRFFDGTDLSLVNLEGPISSGSIEPNTNPNNVVFNFPLETANVLKWLNINAVSLANNHTSNAGQSGLENTQNILNEKKISYIGQQFEFNDNSIKRFSYGNQKISVIAIDILDNYKNLNEIIKTEKQNSGFVLVFSHWGNEFEKTHSSLQQKLAYAWIDAGADLIIGSHPHVIQDAEIYKDKVIFYSLGNLLFDQTFSTHTQKGLVLAGKIKDNKLEKIILLPTISKNLRPELLRGNEKTDFVVEFRKKLGLEISNKDYGYDIIDL
ncbi:MAG: CapA family protein [Patescibacteria group bacterium]|nr:CapA family protein [Patescibacteria group bacterium]